MILSQILPLRFSEKFMYNSSLWNFFRYYLTLWMRVFLPLGLLLLQHFWNFADKIPETNLISVTQLCSMNSLVKREACTLLRAEASAQLFFAKCLSESLRRFRWRTVTEHSVKSSFFQSVNLPSIGIYRRAAVVHQLIDLGYYIFHL